ncbi:hypothetical protein K0504_03595 [Neiella marina]|uniref:Uncharacterized protein n=1 Tax=Neiella holothuriorum TaxID=2870530 RepID=A0ABS7ED12_9GAMM|nr:hypothetical protein [Neiella holothuriorum]MBW8190109.1 hypothetical protein [Neiella holothuriorum]
MSLEQTDSKTSFAIVLGILVSIIVAIILWPNPHRDLMELADKVGLEEPERSRFIYLVSESRRQPFLKDEQASIVNEQDKNHQLLENLSEFMTPDQLAMVEQQCIIPASPICITSGN